MQVLSIVITIVGLLGFVLAALVGIAGREPNDGSVIGILLIEVLMVIMAVLNVIALLNGTVAFAPAWEILIYVAVALAIPIIALYWALHEKDRWSNFVLAIACLVVVVLNVRIQQLWFGA